MIFKQVFDKKSSTYTYIIASSEGREALIIDPVLETIILMNQKFDFSKALKTAMGMSFISMLSMEITMNLTDYFITGGARLNWWVVPIMLTVGFITPWPYNYWRLKKYNIACH